MGQGDGFDRRPRNRNKPAKLIDGQKFGFDATGKVTAGGVFDGLTIDPAALQAYQQSGIKAMQDQFMAKVSAQDEGGYTHSDPDIQAYRMYGKMPNFEAPFTKGGSVAGMQFGSDGQLYSVVNNAWGGQSKIAMKGWNLDTSTLPAGTPGKFYNASIQADQGGNLIQISDPDRGNVVGWARQKLQQALAPDARNSSAKSRLFNSGPDARTATVAPATGGPAAGKSPLVR